MGADDKLRWIAWRPQRSAIWPFVVFLASVAGIYGLLRLVPSLEPNLLLWAVAAGYLLIASYYVQRVRRRGLEALGASERNWRHAMGLGLALGVLLGAIALVRSLLAGGALFIPRMNLDLLAFAVPLALVVAGEEVFFRGWFRFGVEPALGVLPTALIAALAYAAWPFAFLLADASASRLVHTPIGLVSLTGVDFLLLFVVAVFLNIAYRLTNSLWASGLANFLSRFALVFVAQPSVFSAESSPFVLVVSLTLWAVALLYSRRWARGVAA